MFLQLHIFLNFFYHNGLVFVIYGILQGYPQLLSVPDIVAACPGCRKDLIWYLFAVVFD